MAPPYREILATVSRSIMRNAHISANHSWTRTTTRAQVCLNFSPICIRNFHSTASGNSSGKFSYGIAAAFTAKDRRFRPDMHIFNFSLYNDSRVRSNDKYIRFASGQDAFFIARVGESADIAMGIADGVGGWVDSGVDPADFSHGLCNYMAHAAYTHRGEEWNPPFGARSLMQRGYEAICNDKSVPAGSSTACVAVAKEDGSMEVANLGDSGFIQLRLNAIHDYSNPQTHAFNTPYQLSVVPKATQRKIAVFGGPQLCDQPKDANFSQLVLRHGDVLVFASDGLWDNLSSSDVLKIVSKIMLDAKAWEHTAEGISISKGLQRLITSHEEGAREEVSNLQSFLATRITGEAKAASLNPTKNGPFAREMQKYNPYENWTGGKIDDICIVVAVVCEEEK